LIIGLSSDSLNYLYIKIILAVDWHWMADAAIAFRKSTFMLDPHQRNHLGNCTNSCSETFGSKINCVEYSSEAKILKIYICFR
jgi:hypothetical protein